MKINNTNILDFPFVKDKKIVIDYLFAKKNTLIPIKQENGKIFVAISDPTNFDVINELRLLIEKEIDLLIFSKEQIEEAIEICYHQKQEKIILKTDNPEKATEGYDLLESANQNPIIKLLNSIITDAIRQQASDIHFEPEGNFFNVRFRIDGFLQDRQSPPPEYASQIITRLKVLANLDIAEKRQPQDGRIKLMINKREIDFRVSTIPVVHGERVVLRILDKKNIILGLDDIGMKDNILDPFKEMIKFSEGIVLVTGPTGSGKTTTLYSAISEIYSKETNIMTIEDPVEYKLTNIAQIAVNPKIDLTFAKGLRHILRQDPDVIMIGEIRDKETAEIAIQASLTGHLVFSTLHTNDAPSAIVRLVDMGIEPYLLSSSIIGVLAQRLVRILCPYCKKEIKPSKDEKINLDVKQLYKPIGCSKCFHSGYLGRQGIYEIMPMTKNIKKRILKDVDSQALKDSLDSSYIDLKSYASFLLREGVTTIEEILRVTKNI